MFENFEILLVFEFLYETNQSLIANQKTKRLEVKYSINWSRRAI